MGWGEPHDTADIDSRVTLIADLVAMTTRGEIHPAVAVQAIDRVLPVLLQHLRELPAAATGADHLPAWIENEIRHLTQVH
jgi:hypothetical protein